MSCRIEVWLTLLAAVYCVTIYETEGALGLVAQADGKSFYAERTPGRTWSDARDYCIANGMEFATITSRAQFDALSTAAANGWQWSYWVNARDAHSLKQFNWEDTKFGLTSEHVEFKPRPDEAYLSCVFFWAEKPYGRVSYTVCDYPLGALCQKYE